MDAAGEDLKRHTSISWLWDLGKFLSFFFFLWFCHLLKVVYGGTDSDSEVENIRLKKINVEFGKPMASVI